METYALGYTHDELERLMLHARLLRPMTERLLRRSGIGAGMRVLDIGTGAGDVALLAAELVGPSGSVNGIDRDARSVALARHRPSWRDWAGPSSARSRSKNSRRTGHSTPWSAGTSLCARLTPLRSSGPRRGTCALAA
jgi:hypothetical protein